MSLIRPAAAKVFHQISRRQQAAPLSTTNHQNEGKLPDPASSRPVSRPSFKTKRQTPPSRQSRAGKVAPKSRNVGQDLNVFGNNLPASPYRDLEFDRHLQNGNSQPRCGSAVRPFIGVSSKLRTRRLMTPATPMTPTSKVLSMVAEESRCKKPPLPVIGVSGLRSRRLMTPMTPMTPVRTMVSDASTSPGLGFSTAPRTNRVSSLMTSMTMSPMTGPSTTSGPCYVQNRTFKKIMDCTEKILRGRKPCFSVKKLKPKKKPLEWSSPCACDYQKGNQDRCSLWKCRPTFRECPKPTKFQLIHKCPKRVKKPRMKRIVVKKRKIRLGYKKCVKPPNAKEPFQCFPKPPPPPPPPKPTPKRCPCFKPQELTPPPPCKKIPCAIESNCKRKPRKLDVSCPCKKDF